MGISTIRSYRGAKIFESIGLSESLPQHISEQRQVQLGIGLDTIAKDAIAMLMAVLSSREKSQKLLFLLLKTVHWRKDGIQHAWNPETIALFSWLQKQGTMIHSKNIQPFTDKKEKPIFIRSFFDFKRRLFNRSKTICERL